MRFIDTDSVELSVEEFEKLIGGSYSVYDFVSLVPTVQPERKMGKWIKIGQSFVFPEKFMNYSCSECGYDVEKTKFNFCPNCGAK